MKNIVLCTMGLVFCTVLATKAQNNIGINTSNPDASAALEVKSTTQGMLIPRMTKAQRNGINMVSGVSTPATGLLIYQTDDTPGFYFYDGSGWITLNSGPINATIADGAVTTAKIADNAVSSSKIANGAVDMSKLNITGSPTSESYLRSDGSWGVPAGLNLNNTVYTAKKATGVVLMSFGVFPTGFRPVNFLASDRTVGSAALFSDADNTYIIPSTGVYQIGFNFRYGSGIQNGVLSNTPGVGILRTRAGVSTLISSRPFSAATFAEFAMTISEAGINSIFSFQAGDRISLGLTGSNALDAGILGMSSADFFIYKVSN